MKQLVILPAAVLAMFIQTATAVDSEYEAESRNYCMEQARLAGLEGEQAEAEFVADCLASMGVSGGEPQAAE